jgi:hypothetical protein
MNLFDLNKGLFSMELLLLLAVFALIILIGVNKQKKNKQGGPTPRSKPKSKPVRKEESYTKPSPPKKPIIQDKQESWLNGINGSLGHTPERLSKFEELWPSLAESLDCELNNLDTKRLCYLSFLSGEKKSEAEMKFEKKHGDKTVAKRIVDKELWIGMSKEMLLDVKGSPDHKTERVTSNKKKEEFFYGEYKNLRGNDSYKFRVVLINDVVESWNDI